MSSDDLVNLDLRGDTRFNCQRRLLIDGASAENVWRTVSWGEGNGCNGVPIIATMLDFAIVFSLLLRGHSQWATPLLVRGTKWS